MLKCCSTGAKKRSKSRKSVDKLLWALVAIGLSGGVALSAEPDSSTIVYDADFFAQHNVTTVEEILRRMPGVAAILDDADSGGGGQQRGFGSDGDQILIDGRRLAGKSNEISSALRRIQMPNVDRVELLRGTSGDIDVRSDGVVVNIVLKEGTAAGSSGAVTLAVQLTENGSSELDGEINYNSEVGKLSYFVSLDKNSVSLDGPNGYSRRTQDEMYFFPDGELMQVRNSVAERALEEYSFTANSTYHFERGDKLRLNALVKPSSSQELAIAPFSEFDIDGTPGLSAIDVRSAVVDDRLEWEFGGTYERGLGNSGNLKILTVYNYEDTSSVDARNQLSGEVLDEIGRNLSDVLDVEAILRSSYYRPLSENQSVEFGAEVASNSLDQTIQIFADQDDDGVAEQIDIFNPSSKVEEIRSEVFVNHNWTLNGQWTASSSLVAESSEITQRGVDINSTTSFNFLKPRIDIRYAANAFDQVRFKIERTVSQLNFANFVPRFNIREDRFTAGNPFLRPETAWEHEIAIERRLQDDQGVISARVYYHDIQDRIESVAIDLNSDGEFDPATGNIGDGTENGWELAFSLRMTKFGVPDLILSGRYLTRNSSVIDPFTGTERKMATSSDQEIEVAIRHDMTSANLSYGISYEHNDGNIIRREWRESREFSRRPEVTAFIEKKFDTRWTLRFDALSIAQDKRERRRFLYAENATDGNIRELQFRDEFRDRRYTISLTSTF